MATPLNKDLREQILENAMAGAFEAQIRQATSALAKECVFIQTEVTKDFVIPEEFVSKSNSFTLHSIPRKGQKSFVVHFNSNNLLGYSSDGYARSKPDGWDEDWWSFDNPAPQFTVPTSRCFQLSKYKKVDDKKLRALYNTLEGLLKSKKELGANINAVLHSVPNIERLLVAWPDVDQFLPVIVSTHGRSITVRIDEMNALLKASRI